MKLMTPEIEATLPKLYSTDGQGENAMIPVKYFDPMGSWTWYVIEGERQDDGDLLFFGWVDGDFPEYGNFLLSELESIAKVRPIGIERDLYWTPKKLGEIKNGH